MNINVSEFRTMQQDVRGLQQDVSQLKSDVRSLDVRASSLEADMKEVKADVKEILAVVNRGKGALWLGITFGSVFAAAVGFLASFFGVGR